MIFAFATDDGSLFAVRSEQAAIAQAEGIDVQDGAWRFFDSDGSELEPVFSTPNQRGAFVVTSGTYTLRRPATPRGALTEALSRVTSVSGMLDSVSDVIAAVSGTGSWRRAS